MAGASLLTLLDDITSVLDDVATLTKMAAKKTAGVLGDDLALNAHQVSEVQAERELPVVWAVAKGSLVNKVILVPVALLLSSFAPWLVSPLLMVGGAYLCFEGAETLWHWMFPGPRKDAEALKTELTERQRITGAVRTDFILSAEIIIISLGTVAEYSLGIRIAVMCAIALLMTVGVYGLVAAIVKLDDVGLYLTRRAARGTSGKLLGTLGTLLVIGAPYLTRSLSVIGTVAMFMVGGGILLHGVPPVAHLAEQVGLAAASVPIIGTLLDATVPTLLGMLTGALAGSTLVAIWTGILRLVRHKPT